MQISVLCIFSRRLVGRSRNCHSLVCTSLGARVAPQTLNPELDPKTGPKILATHSRRTEQEVKTKNQKHVFAAEFASPAPVPWPLLSLPGSVSFGNLSASFSLLAPPCLSTLLHPRCSSSRVAFLSRLPALLTVPFPCLPFIANTLSKNDVNGEYRPQQGIGESHSVAGALTKSARSLSDACLLASVCVSLPACAAF